MSLTKLNYISENTVEIIAEGRPRLVQHMLYTVPSALQKYRIKNLETGKNKYLKISGDPQYEHSLVFNFLKDINAYASLDDVDTIRSKVNDYSALARILDDKGQVNLWVPENRMGVIQTTYELKNASVSGESNHIEQPKVAIIQLSNQDVLPIMEHNTELEATSGVEQPQQPEDITPEQKFNKDEILSLVTAMKGTCEQIIEKLNSGNGGTKSSM